ncbi:MAG: lamin tail domain-containing protein [Ardenticatenales bacterium]|nr:lamin tail domain-containing protein [Ardenticatenales bacterium]
MSKGKSRPIEVPLLDGVTLWMSELQALGADESVTIKNIGTIPQPLNSWVLASLRGESFYTFPEGTILEPGGEITVHSGPSARNNPPKELFWTKEHIWNNQSDTAVLFDATGHEVARMAQGRSRSEEQGRKLLYRDEEGMHIEDSAPHKMEKRRGNNAPELGNPPENAPDTQK